METSAAPLTDLLPSLFDSAVMRLTRRPLLPTEREAILTALVNSVGEAVLRRARQEGSSSKPQEITAIDTFDRFSDEWMSRLEIVEGIHHSSGLGPTLSELALFLIESRLDLLLSTQDQTAIVGIGQIIPARSMLEIHPKAQEVFDLLYKAFNAASAPTGWRDGLRRFLRLEDERPARCLVEKAQVISTLRQPLSYKIHLWESLAFKSTKPNTTESNVRETDENRVSTEQFLKALSRIQTSAPA